jgi:integrase
MIRDFKTRSAASVNRRLVTLRLILARAAKWRDPLTNQLILNEVPQFEDFPEPKRKARPTPEPVIERLIRLLPPHALDALMITLFFGFRSSEAFSLQESQVDWHAEGIRLFHDDVKDNEDSFLPGSQLAMGYLRCLAMEAQERGLRHLISFRREATRNADRQEPWRPIKKSRTAWKTAMKTIESEFGARWRWHDLRAAFITHVAITSGPVAAQALARHADFDTTRAYIEVADQVTRDAADKAVDRPAFN